MGAVENIITDNLPIWSSAIQSKSSAGRGTSGKRNLYGVKKLRELILDLAVRGLLVPQDPSDEPASVLLEKIAAEKEILVKGGKIKKQKPLPNIEKIEENLPTNWKATRFGNVINILNGRAYKKNEMLSQGTPLLRVGNLFTSNDWYYSDLELEPNKYIDDGDLIYAWSASFGPFIWKGGKVIYHYHIWKLDFYDGSHLSKDYTYLYLANKTAAIKASGNGIAMLHMTKERMEKLVFPIPPLAEQHRIVAKVDELMGLCDTLERQQEDSIQAHETLVEVLLEALSSAVDADAFHAAWGRISKHFDVLFTTEHSIKKLKETILQLAVMGKLVPQDPNDEPASVLLEKIAAEKERLVKEGKIKKPKSITNHLKKKPNYNLSDGWVFCKLLDIIQISSGDGLTSSNMNKDGHVPVYGGNGVTGYHDQANVSDETLVIGRVGFYCGSVHVTPASAWITDNAFITWHSKNLLSQAFLVHLLRSTNLKEDESATAQPVISGKKIYPIIVGLPPLAEQHRIVAKVDELLALCDKLKSSLQQAQETQILLTDAVVENAL